MRRWQMSALAAAAVLGAAGLSFAFPDDGSTDQEMELTASDAATTGVQQYRFTVKATPVDGLYPGAVRQLRLTFANPYAFDLHVTAIRATVVATSKPGCAPIATNLEVQPYTGSLPLRVKAKDREQAGTVPLHMPNSVANDCQAAAFTITLHADAGRGAR